MRAVFDSNVVLSALVFGRRLFWLRRAWASGAVTPIACRETVTELVRVLAYRPELTNWPPGTHSGTEHEHHAAFLNASGGVRRGLNPS